MFIFLDASRERVFFRISEVYICYNVILKKYSIQDRLFKIYIYTIGNILTWLIKIYINKIDLKKLKHFNYNGKCINL